MAEIREELVLADRFSGSFSKFIELGERTSGSIDQLNSTITAYIQHQEQMAQATARAREAQRIANEQKRAAREEARAQQLAERQALQEQKQAEKDALAQKRALAQSEKEEQRKVAQAAKEAARQKRDALRQEHDELKRHNQAVKEAAEAEKRLYNQGREATDGFNRLATAVRGAIVALGGLAAVRGVVQLSDQLTMIQSRIDAIDPGHIADGMSMVYEAAQKSRGQLFAMLDSVTKLKMQAPETFTSLGEATRFMELLNKQFKLSGTSATGIESTMYNLTQAMSTGVLRGNDFRAVIENAPAIVQMIADKMNVTQGEVKKLAEQGQLSADIVKNAIMEAGDKIDKKFEKLPMTFGDAVNQVKNDAIYQFQAMSQQISAALNTQEFIDAMNTLSEGIVVVTNLAVLAFQGLGDAMAWAKQNADWLVPVLATIVGAIVTYNVVTGVFAAISAVATAAQWAFNGAIMACPIAWIVAAIVALIAVLIAVVMWLHKVSNTGHSVFGDVAGVAMGCFEVIKNALAVVANVFLTVAEFFVNTWNEAVYNVQLFVYNFVSGAIDAFNGIISGADAAATALANAFISGVNEAASALDGLIDLINQLPGFSIGHLGRLGQVSSVISARIDKSGLVAPTKAGKANFGRYETTSIGEAFSKGFEKGAAKGDEVQADLGDALGKLTQKLGVVDTGYGAGAGSGTATGLGDALGGTGGGKSNVGTVDKVKNVDDVTLSDEDLKIYRDLAERKYMAQLELKTLAPNITVNIPEGQAKYLTANDVADKLKTMLIEQMNGHTAVSYGM